MAREILTLQFGHYSNFVGSHFWNIQELSFDYTGKVQPEFNHDILYREGISNGNITYTPRLLLADLKGSLRTLPQTGGLEQNEIDDDLNNVERIAQPVAEKNEFLVDLDSAGTSKDKHYEFEKFVSTWTDFLYPRFHHRTVNVIQEYEHSNEKNLFETFPQGVNTWKTSYGDEFSDKIRQYVEECDSMQGFHVSFDATDAFSGLATSCTEHIVDDYSKPIIAFPVISPHFPDNNPATDLDITRSNVKDSIRLINLALMFDSISEHASLFIPISTAESGWRKPGKKRLFQNTYYNHESHYHTSAILASALDNLSLRYRHKTDGYTISDICADMSAYGRKMAAASLGLPFPMNSDEDLIDYLNRTEVPFYTSITPSCKLENDKICQLFTVRGIPEARLKRHMNEAKHQISLPAYKCDSVKDMFQLYFQANCFLSLTNVSVMQTPLEVKQPYPDIFTKNLTKDGFVAEYDLEQPQNVPVIAGYHNGEFISDTIERLHREAKRIDIRKLPQFKQEGLEDLEIKECLDKIEEFKQNYDTDFDL